MLPQELQDDKNFLTKRNAGLGPNGSINPLSEGVLGTQDGSGGPNNGVDVNSVYLDNSFPVTPVAGLHVVRINSGERPSASHGQ